MAYFENDSEILERFDQLLVPLLSASEALREAWSQVFNGTVRNLFRKLDFKSYQRAVVCALENIKDARAETKHLSHVGPIFYELDRFAHFLESFGFQLNECLGRLSEKADGIEYSYPDYKRDVDLLDGFREQLVESQERYNAALREFISQIDVDDLPDLPVS